MKLIAILVMVAMPLAANSAVYKCQKDGATTFSDKPCGDDAKKIEIQTQKANRDPSDVQRWIYIEHTDEMTGVRTCLAQSPMILAGGNGQDLNFATLRVGRHFSQPIVAINGEYSFGSNAVTSYHNNIRGLGIKVGDNPFIRVDKKRSSTMLSFSLGDSKTIVDQLMEATSFRVRVRYWPYDQTYDSGEVPMTGFSDALEKAMACES